MERILQLTNELADEFINSGLYKEYNRLKVSLEDNPELKVKIDEFKIKSESYEIKLLQTGEDSFDEEKIVSSLYSEVMLYEDGKLYLDAEKKLYGLLDQMFTILENRCRL